MAKAKITITGITEKTPKLNQDGTVDLIFKIGMSSQVPKGLKSLGESYYIVHIGPKTWKKVSNIYKEDSFYIIQGESKASKTQSGTALIEVVCFDISLKDQDDNISTAAAAEIKEPVQQKPIVLKSVQEIKKVEPDNIIKKENSTVKPTQKKNIESQKNMEHNYQPVKWYNPEDVKNMHLTDICLVEPIHFSTVKLILNGILKAVSISGKLNSPVVVRPLEDRPGKYGLVMGLKQYTAAKMINIDIVPVVITNMSHQEYTDHYGVITLDK